METLFSSNARLLQLHESWLIGSGDPRPEERSLEIRTGDAGSVVLTPTG